MNRFLILERGNDRPDPARFPGVRRRLAGAQSKGSRCRQSSELEVDPDTFVLDVLAFFFDERLTLERLNTPLRELAARVLYEAKKASKAMDAVPRAPGWRPGVAWLVSQGVQMAFRVEQNRCIYDAVRVTIKRNFRSEYVLARDIAEQQSVTEERTVSARGIEMIRAFEGFRPGLYGGPDGHCHIGYGHLVHPGACDGSEPDEFQAGITEPRARQLLEKRVAATTAFVAGKSSVTLNQERLDALVSFCLNVGEGAFARSTLLEKLNQGDHAAVATELRKWVRGGGKTLPGLVRRRAAEAELYEHGHYAAQAPGLSLGDADAAQTESNEEGEIEDGPHLMAATLSTTVPDFCAPNEAETAGTPHFELAEFACSDGTPVPTSLRGHVQDLMEQLEVLRTELGGAPITVLSGYRTPEWNGRVNGKPRSRHLCAQAADIRVKGHKPDAVHATIERLVGEGRMREGGLGRYRTFTHYDVRGTRARW